MFAEACRRAMCYTKPLIACFVNVSGAANAGNGSMVIVNSDGWFLTAAHMFSSLVKQQSDAPHVQKYTTEVAEIEALTNLDAKHKQKRISKLPHDGQWIAGTSFWWSPSINAQPRPLVTSKLVLIGDHDLALGQIADFDPACVTEYPVFKCKPPLEPGTSLCRLGFPFTNIRVTIDHATREISIDVEGLSFFPNDGILTRELPLRIDSAGNAVRAIETSSAGLRGQSGGPIFDRHGTVWAIQSMTGHHSLGFDPPDPGSSNRTVHQFMNVGLGVHPESIVGAMEKHNVSFRREGEAT